MCDDAFSGNARLGRGFLGSSRVDFTSGNIQPGIFSLFPFDSRKPSAAEKLAVHFFLLRHAFAPVIEKFSVYSFALGHFRFRPPGTNPISKIAVTLSVGLLNSSG